MNYENSILALADRYERFAEGDSSVTYIENDKQSLHKRLFGFANYGDKESFVAALMQMEKTCAELGVTELVGPVNYNSWFGYRFATSGFDLDLYPDIHNSPETIAALGSCGYSIKYAYESNIIAVTEQLLRSVNLAATSDRLVVKYYDGAEAAYGVVDRTYSVAVECFKNSVLYSPVSYEIYREIYLAPLRDIHPDLFVVCDGGLPVGFSFGYANPDGEYYIVKTLAVLPSYRKSKALYLLISAQLKLLAEKNYYKCVFHYQREGNNEFGYFTDKFLIGKKTYAVFGKKLKAATND